MVGIISGPKRPLFTLEVMSACGVEGEVLMDGNATEGCPGDDIKGGGSGGGGGEEEGECDDLSCAAEALVMVTDEVEGNEARDGKSRDESTSIFSSTPLPKLLANNDLGPTDEPHEDNSLPPAVPLPSLSSGEPSLQLPPCGLSIFQSSKLLWRCRKLISSMFIRIKSQIHSNKEE